MLLLHSFDACEDAAGRETIGCHDRSSPSHSLCMCSCMLVVMCVEGGFIISSVPKFVGENIVKVHG